MEIEGEGALLRPQGAAMKGIGTLTEQIISVLDLVPPPSYADFKEGELR